MTFLTNNSRFGIEKSCMLLQNMQWVNLRHLLVILVCSYILDRPPAGNKAVRQAQMVTCQVLSTALICVKS